MAFTYTNTIQWVASIIYALCNWKHGCLLLFMLHPFVIPSSLFLKRYTNFRDYVSYKLTMFLLFFANLMASFGCLHFIIMSCWYSATMIWCVMFRYGCMFWSVNYLLWKDETVVAVYHLQKFPNNTWTMFYTSCMLLLWPSAAMK